MQDTFAPVIELLHENPCAWPSPASKVLVNLNVQKERLMTLTGVIDDHVLQHYRELLDQEDAAFDGLEHAYEDGDRNHFEADLTQWTAAAQRRLAYLKRLGVDLEFA